MRIILVWSYSFSCHKKYIRQIVNLNSNGHKSNKTIKWKLFKQLFYGWLTNFPNILSMQLVFLDHKYQILELETWQSFTFEDTL